MTKNQFAALLMRLDAEWLEFQWGLLLDIANIIG